MAATRRIAMEECASVDLAALKAAGALCDGKVMRATQEWHRDKEKIARFTVTVDLSGASDANCQVRDNRMLRCSRFSDQPSCTKRLAR